MCAGVLLCCSVYFFLSLIFKLTSLIQVFILAIESDHFLDVGFRNQIQLCTFWYVTLMFLRPVYLKFLKLLIGFMF